MYWWTRLFVRIVIFVTVLAFALVAARLLFYFLLGCFGGYLVWCHKKYKAGKHYASEDHHYA